MHDFSSLFTKWRAESPFQLCFTRSWLKLMHSWAFSTFKDILYLFKFTSTTVVDLLIIRRQNASAYMCIWISYVLQTLIIMYFTFWICSSENFASGMHITYCTEFSCGVTCFARFSVAKSRTGSSTSGHKITVSAI